MANKDNRYIFFVIFLVLGVLLAVQFRSTLYANRQKSAAALDVELLMTRIKEEMSINNQLRSQLEESTVKRQALLKAIIESQNDTALKREWDSILLKAGLTDVSGPGIVIKLDDAEAREDVDNPELLIIHDQDIRIILNELKCAGAQAISINGERIMPMSEQVCAGPTILINRNRYAVPYVISVIGNPDLLYDAMINSERIIRMLEDKIRIEIKKSKNIVIPKFSGIDNISTFISGLEAVEK